MEKRSPIITRSLEELIALEPKVLSMGFKPSGAMHLGSWTTIFVSMYALSEIPGASLDLEIMDLDFDLQRGSVSMPYSRLVVTDPLSKEKMPAAEFLRAQFEQAITQAEGIIGSHIADRIRINTFSNTLMESNMLETFLGPFIDGETTKRMKRALFDGAGSKYDIPFFPICPSCGLSASRFGHRFGREYIRTKCLNPNCEIDEYSVLLNTPQDYNIHYLVDPLRDAIETPRHPKADVHIFGGDYGAPTGRKRIPKAVRVVEMIEAAGFNPPVIFIGPEVTIGGLKMTKTGGFGLTVEETPHLEDYSHWLIDRLMSEPPYEIDFIETPFAKL